MSTIRDVATHAKVSISTVSHVINGTRFVDPETEGRVRIAIQALGYQPNSVARSLRRGNTDMIALIVPDNANLYFAELARAIEDTGFAEGFSVILCNSDGSEQKEQVYINSLLSRKIDGFIFIPLNSSTKRLKMIIDAQVPVVIADRSIEGVAVDQVYADNEQGGYQAGKYLIRLGHRRIGCISGPPWLSPSVDRVAGFKRALAEAGVELADEAIAHGDFRDTGGQAAMDELLKRNLDLTAIFAANDLMAIGAIYVLRRHRLRTPEDVSVIGFDDSILASLMSPLLTTIAQPLKEIGQQSTSLLLQRIRGLAAEPSRIILPTTLVERESCINSTSDTLLLQ